MKLMIYFALIFSVTLNAQAWKWPKIGGDKKSESAVKQILLKTPESCSASLPVADKFLTNEWTIGIFKWEGACLNGKANGFGWLSQKIKGSYYKYLFLEMNNGILNQKPIIYSGMAYAFIARDELSSIDCSKVKTTQCDTFIKELSSRIKPNVIKTEDCFLAFHETYATLINTKWLGKCENGLAEGIGVFEYTNILAENYRMRDVVSFHKGTLNNNFVVHEWRNPDGNVYTIVRQINGLTFTDHFDEPPALCMANAECKKMYNLGRQLLNGGGSNNDGSTPPVMPINTCDLNAIGTLVNAYMEAQPPTEGICDGAKSAARQYHYAYKAMVKYCPNSEEDRKARYRQGRDENINTANQTCSDPRIQFDEP